MPFPQLPPEPLNLLRAAPADGQVPLAQWRQINTSKCKNKEMDERKELRPHLQTGLVSAWCLWPGGWVPDLAPRRLDARPSHSDFSPNQVSAKPGRVNSQCSPNFLSQGWALPWFMLQTPVRKALLHGALPLLRASVDPMPPFFCPFESLP